MSLGRQKNAVVVNVLTGAHDGRAEVDPGISLVDSLSSLCTLTEMKSEVETEWKSKPALCHTHFIL